MTLAASRRALVSFGTAGTAQPAAAAEAVMRPRSTTCFPSARVPPRRGTASAPWTRLMTESLTSTDAASGSCSSMRCTMRSSDWTTTTGQSSLEPGVRRGARTRSRWRRPACALGLSRRANLARLASTRSPCASSSTALWTTQSMRRISKSSRVRGSSFGPRRRATLRTISPVRRETGAVATHLHRVGGARGAPGVTGALRSRQRNSASHCGGAHRCGERAKCKGGRIVRPPPRYRFRRPAAGTPERRRDRRSAPTRWAARAARLRVAASTRAASATS